MALTATTIPVTKTGGTSPVIQNGSLTDTGSSGGTGDVYTDAWADYGGTSTIGGFSGTPTAHIYTKKVGKTVFVEYILQGTSNATSVSFTVPYAASASSANNFLFVTQAHTNSAYAAGIGQISSSTVTIYASMSGGNFTNGNSGCSGSFCYQSAS